MKKFALALLTLVIAAFLVGCGSKINQENFDKLKDGMTKAEVVAILGEPTGTELVGQINDKEIRGPVWEGGGLKIVTMFSDEGKLQVKRLDKE